MCCRSFLAPVGSPHVPELFPSLRRGFPLALDTIAIGREPWRRRRMTEHANTSGSEKRRAYLGGGSPSARQLGHFARPS